MVQWTDYKHLNKKKTFLKSQSLSNNPTKQTPSFSHTNGVDPALFYLLAMNQSSFYVSLNDMMIYLRGIILQDLLQRIFYFIEKDFLFIMKIKQ